MTTEEGDDRVCAKRKLRRFRDELLSPLPLPLKRLRPSGARALPLKLALEPTTPSTESAESVSCRSAVAHRCATALSHCAFGPQEDGIDLVQVDGPAAPKDAGHVWEKASIW